MKYLHPSERCLFDVCGVLEWLKVGIRESVCGFERQVYLVLAIWALGLKAGAGPVELRRSIVVIVSQALLALHWIAWMLRSRVYVMPQDVAVIEWG
ncbi:hypothetical protein AF72_12895 [Xylella taiwanensis]|uniref:Uncharacterized protein n=1 Tax=Xylella taiwanensis TaxID=1444770 RepID=Z9JGY4_9GAMM|nr:hypothetical protein [Xylella taiwanensis]EWS77051.1 hypothetical protein AF72_12895 [Xylella taiwanensis]MCD8467571.1 hypothetical protein [Xylella taiwanensis]